MQCYILSNVTKLIISFMAAVLCCLTPYAKVGDNKPAFTPGSVIGIITAGIREEDVKVMIGKANFVDDKGIHWYEVKEPALKYSYLQIHYRKDRIVDRVLAVELITKDIGKR